MKKYKIETVQDMLDCTNEDNLDSFLQDLKILLSVSHTVRIIDENLELPPFTWIEDSKNNFKLRIEEK